ncbi:nectin-1-like isoform X2 [Sardina pilchardus]|uniref:nectin-1-like isoform X2 n=1 Tax=Sardina pilchardus TaxID=27697 RepID=UPI002E13A32E
MAKRVHLQYLGMCVLLLHLSHGDKVASINTPLGENVTLHCNTSGMDITNIRWIKDGIKVFTYSPVLEGNPKNKYTSERMSVAAPHDVLHISDVHVSDEGIYTCEVATPEQHKTDSWNLTVTSVPPDPSQSHWINVITAASGTIIVSIIICSMLCIYRFCDSFEFSNLHKVAMLESEDVMTEVFISAKQQGTISSKTSLDV